MTEEHLPLDELAQLAEGLLRDEAAEAARAHLAGCAQCQERAAAVDSATALLAGLPPVTMPADVAARLEQALAAAGPLDSDEPAAADSGGSGSRTVIPDVTDIRTHRRWSVPTMATSAVAAIVVLLVGALVIAHIGRGSSSGSSAGAAGSVSAASSAANGPVGTNTAKDFATLSTGQVYDENNLSTLVSGLVTSAHSSSASGSGASSSDSKNAAGASAAASPPQASPHARPSQTHGDSLAPAARLPSPAVSHARLLSCAAALATTPGAVPVAVDFARWTGGQLHRAPSIIIVFNGPRAGTLAVYVVGPTCDPNQIRTYTIVTPTG